MRAYEENFNSNQTLSSKPARTFELSSSEKNRLRTEREFLSLCAHNPAMVPDFVNELGQTEWHDKVHRELALALIEILSNNPSLSVADVIRKAQEICPYAERILTSSSVSSSSSVYDLLRFMADELIIGDTENAIAAMRIQMKSAQTQEEADMVFQSILVLQSELNSLRNRHVKTN